MIQYGLLGKTLTHSFSKSYFTKKFTSEGINDVVYKNFELFEIGGFPDLLQANPLLRGLNVTLPYKEDVLHYLTKKTDVVNDIGACNCIKIEGDRLTGYNTDAIGFRRSLQPLLKTHHKKALVLGTGGASKAICYALLQMGIGYQLVSRRKQEGLWQYEDLNEAILSEYQLVINTTPVGTSPAVDDAPPIPYSFLTPQHFLFDLVYNPAKTRFLAEGERRGAQICNGYQMLIEQAEESWRIWNLGEEIYGAL